MCFRLLTKPLLTLSTEHPEDPPVARQGSSMRRGLIGWAHPCYSFVTHGSLIHLTALANLVVSK